MREERWGWDSEEGVKGKLFLDVLHERGICFHQKRKNEKKKVKKEERNLRRKNSRCE